MIKGVDHIGLVVNDLDKQLSFYKDILGLKVVHAKEVGTPPGGKDHIGITDLRRKLVFLSDESGDLALELIYHVHPKSPIGEPCDRHQACAMHLCFLVENIQEKYEHLLNKGVQFLSPPVVIDRPIGGPVGLVYFQDAEGNWMELKEEMGT